jgi:hypothetical protein
MQTRFERSVSALRDVDEVAGDRGGCGRCRRHRIGAALEVLTVLEIAVRSRRSALPRRQFCVSPRRSFSVAALFARDRRIPTMPYFALICS